MVENGKRSSSVDTVEPTQLLCYEKLGPMEPDLISAVPEPVAEPVISSNIQEIISPEMLVH